MYCIVEANVERATALFLETNDYLLIGVIATCYFVQSDTQDDQRGETNTNTNKNTNANTSPQTNIDTNHYWLIETSYSFSSLQSLRKNFTWPRLCWPSDPQSEGFNVILASRHLVVH